MAEKIKYEFCIEQREGNRFVLNAKPEIEEVEMPILARIASKISERLNWRSEDKKHKVSFDLEGVYLDYEPKSDGTTLNISVDTWAGLEAISNSKEVLERIKPIFEKEFT